MNLIYFIQPKNPKLNTSKLQNVRIVFLKACHDLQILDPDPCELAEGYKCWELGARMNEQREDSNFVCEGIKLWLVLNITYTESVLIVIPSVGFV